MSRNSRRGAALIASLSFALLVPAPAFGDCVRASVSYTSPQGQTTTVGGGCALSTPYPSTVEDDFRVGTTSVGYVSYSYRIPLP